MKKIAVILCILIFPLSLFAIDQLSELDLSEFTTYGSLYLTKGESSDTSGTFWTRFINDPDNMDFFFNEESGNAMEAKSSRTLQDSQYKSPDFTASVSVVGADDPPNAGMSRIEFPNGLIRTNEGPTMVEVWLGGLADQRNAGKMCDFYSNQIMSHTHPKSAISISTH